MANIKQKFLKFHFRLKDHYNLLFSSAALNHLRIEKALKKVDGDEQIAVRFSSYSELKRYQKKVRKLAACCSTAGTMAAVIMTYRPWF